jgi:hypothetical protein
MIFELCGQAQSRCPVKASRIELVDVCHLDADIAGQLVQVARTQGLAACGVGGRAGDVDVADPVGTGRSS